MDNMIAIGDVYSGKHYYPTKGNNFIRLDGTYNTEGAEMYASGSLQSQGGRKVPVQFFYSMDNGYSYVVDEIPMTTNKSVTDVLASHDEFSSFFQIV